MNTNLLHRVLLAGFAACCAVTTQAQQAQLEEVIVTAQKREQRLIDVPAAVAAVGRETIEANEINTIDDLAKIVPSLRFTQDAYINSAVNIRGIGTNVYSIAVEPNVSVMLDGVPLARSSLVGFDFADIERVEVLRGPQGTLFGKNASAGLVHVLTRDPVDEFEARVRATYEHPDDTAGDFSKLQMMVGGPLAEGIGGRVSAFAKRANGHLENIRTGSNAPDSDQFGVRGKLRWDPSDSLTARLNLEFSRKDGTSGLITFRDGSPSLRERSAPIEFSDDNRQARAFDTNLSDSEGHAASFSVDCDIGGHVLTAVTGYREATNRDNITVYGLDGQRGHLRHNFSDIAIETLTQELRLMSRDNDVVEYTAGILWFENKVTEDYDRDIRDLSAAILAGTVAPGLLPQDFGDGLMGNDAVNQYDSRDAAVETSNLGVFAEATWHISDRWHMTGGLRFIDEEVDIAVATTSRLSDASSDNTVSSDNFPLTDAAVNDTAVTGKLALMHELRDNFNVYASFSTGYRGAAFDVAAEDLQNALDNPVQPEKATAYELGFKSRLLDNRIELNAALFLTYFEDFQAQIRDLQNTGSIVSHRLDNAGELETKGLEIELQARPTAGLTIAASYLFNRAVFNEFVTQCFAGQGPDEGGAIDADDDGSCDAQDVSGGVLANAPKHSASLIARYDHTTSSGHEWYGQISGRWQDEVQFTNEQQPTTIEDAYAIWNLRLGWHLPDAGWEAAFYIKNLFAQTYTNNLIPLSVSNDRRDVVHNLPLDADRVYGVTLSRAW